MKATLKFKLPEEREEFENAVKANIYASMVFHLENNLWRELCKHTECSEDYEKGVKDSIKSLISYLED